MPRGRTTCPHPGRSTKTPRPRDISAKFDLDPVQQSSVWRLLLGFVVMIFFGHVVVAICNWTVPRALRQNVPTTRASADTRRASQSRVLCHADCLYSSSCQGSGQVRIDRSANYPSVAERRLRSTLSMNVLTGKVYLLNLLVVVSGIWSEASGCFRPGQVFAASCLACCWGPEPVPRSPPFGSDSTSQEY